MKTRSLSDSPAAIKSRAWRQKNPTAAGKHYREHRAEYVERSRVRRLTHPGEVARTNKIGRARGTAIINAAKAKPCMDCGIQYAPYVMDLDHRDPSTKLRDVSLMRGQREDLLRAEIAKCDVVCANCHRERTERRRAA